MVDSTPFQPMFSPGDFRWFAARHESRAVATEGAALSPCARAAAAADERDAAPHEAHPA